MTIPSTLLLLLLCSTGGEVQSFTVPTPKFRYQPSRDIELKDDTEAFYNSRLTVLSASPKDTKPRLSNFFQRSPKLEIISKRPRNAPPDDEDKSASSKWQSFKDSIYGTVDTIGKVPSSLVGSNDDTSSDLGNRNAPMEYSNTVGKTTEPPPLLSNFIIPQERKTPGQKALIQFQYEEDEPVKSLVKSYNDELDYIPTEEDDLYRSDSRKKFDSAKARFYNSVDFIARTSKKIVGKEDESPALLESDLRRIRPMAKTSANKVPSRRNQQRRDKELKRKQSIDETKETIYTVIDGIKTVGEVVIAIPGETVEVTKDVVVKVQDTVEGVKAFPGQVKNFVGGVRESVEETKRITQEVSTDIKNIPKTVEEKITETQNSIRETKESIRETKQGVLNAVKQGEEALYSAKVKVGMAKPKPKPPPPPPVKTARDIAFEISGSLIWGVAKGSTKLLVGGTKLAWSAYKSSNSVIDTKESNDEAGDVDEVVEDINIVEPIPTIQDAEVVSKSVQKINIEQAKPNVVPSKAVQKINIEKAKPNAVPNFFDKIFKPAAKPSISKASADKAATSVEAEKPTLAEIDPSLEKEVSDALRLGDEALADLGKEENKEQAKPSVVPSKAVQKINIEKAKPNAVPNFFDKIFKPAAKPSISKASMDKVAASIEAEKPTLAEIDPSLEKEVSDALRLAEEALADLEKQEDELAVTNDDIDAAIIKAKIAAAKAKMYAVELEEIVARNK